MPHLCSTTVLCRLLLYLSPSSASPKQPPPQQPWQMQQQHELAADLQHFQQQHLQTQQLQQKQAEEQRQQQHDGRTQLLHQRLWQRQQQQQHMFQEQPPPRPNIICSNPPSIMSPCNALPHQAICGGQRLLSCIATGIPTGTTA
jgi:hypothetical protein